MIIIIIIIIDNRISWPAILWNPSMPAGDGGKAVALTVAVARPLAVAVSPAAVPCAVKYPDHGEIDLACR
jgi:hypothetical protein